MTTPIKSLLPYIGEYVLQHMLINKPELILESFGLAYTEFVTVHQRLSLLFPNSAIRFDGESNIDLGIELTNGSIIPIEVKLGQTGLSRSIVNKKLNDCTVSTHADIDRIKGNILAVLNRNFDEKISHIILDDKLHTTINNQNYPIEERWGIICFDKWIESWEALPPEFNGKQTFISFEALCKSYGKNDFNDLLKSVFEEVDYFETWVE